MKKVLILCQGCDEPPYDKIQQGQFDTWNSVQVEGVQSVFYISDPEAPAYYWHQDGKRLYVPCSKAYDMMHWRHKLSIDAIWHSDWDYVFRTNTSSYVDKNALLEYCQSLPETGVYRGRRQGDFVSGCGAILSRDAVKAVMEGTDSYPTPSEDCDMSRLINLAGIKATDGPRYDVYFEGGLANTPKDLYHYRCKSDTEDRSKDVVAFNYIHKLKGFS